MRQATVTDVGVTMWRQMRIMRIAILLMKTETDFVMLVEWGLASAGAEDIMWMQIMTISAITMPLVHVHKAAQDMVLDVMGDVTIDNEVLK